MDSLATIWPDLEEVAARNGVLRIAATSLGPGNVELFERWLAAGHHGTMRYLEKNAGVRRDPGARWPWARSAIVLTVAYEPERPAAPPGSIARHVARYALGDDYHEVLDRILRELENSIATAAPGTKTWRYVDTGPLSDRDLAAQAGLGWIGRNGMLIDPEHGSWTFIGLLLTSLEAPESVAEVADRCGECTRCIDACPTEAILPGRVVDSNRCISHATIEVRGAIPDAVKDRLDGNIFGCDICQEVCPWNATPAPSHPAFRARETYRATPVTDLLIATQEEFSALFRKSAIKRAKRTGMMRNAMLVTGAVPGSTD
ncbi:MAG: tRNA epoxyqueuosine(34) reductase QueG [Thermoanaerobaculia bacterium]